MQSAEKVVHVIPPTVTPQAGRDSTYLQKRVVAYCRVSTQQEEQLNSYATQLEYYTDYIHRNPDWKFVGIYADKGISGTSVKHREEFNKMIRLCKNGKVDMIITKSISRFARNTLDCLHYTRMLNELGVDVFFEEQGIHSIQTGSEFYITIYGSIAQSESENISANVRWGKAQHAKEGNVPFFYKNFLGYKKGEDGKPAIDEEQAKVVRFIYDSFLEGDSTATIAKKLENDGILSPSGKPKWSVGTIQSILSNERYKGDVMVNKTFIADCLSKKSKVNHGERTKYYIENNHPAIISREKFRAVQAEIARRSGKQKSKQVGTTSLKGKYSGKYALTEFLVCGECKTPYRRCTWTVGGEKKIVWRCIQRLDFGKKYCHHSPTMEEDKLQVGIMRAIQELAMQSGTVLEILKSHIEQGIVGEEQDENIDLRLRIAEIDEEIRGMLESVSADTLDSFDESRVALLVSEKNSLQTRLQELEEEKEKRAENNARLEDIFLILDGLKNHPMDYDDVTVRKLLDTVVVLAKDRIKLVFKGGLEIEQQV